MRIRFLVLLTVAAMLLAVVGPAAAAGPPLPSNGPGSVVGWGRNNYGQTNVTAGNDFLAIDGGDFHGLALKSDGSIVGWGRNDYGQATPPAGNDFVAISAGYTHSLALKSDGSIVGWGWNGFGQATPPAGNDFLAISAGYECSLALKSDGSIVGWGRNDYGQATPPAGNDFVAIDARAMHSLALKSDGSIVGWGYDGFGQNNVPAGNDFVAISGGYYHCLALKSDGSIVGWGRNVEEQATPPAGNDFVAISGGYAHSLALKSDGSIVGWGWNGFGQATPPAGNNFVAISGGYEHSLALKSTNRAPSVTVNAAATAADEGQQATNSGTVSDPDGDNVTLAASVGNVVDNGDGTWSWTFDAIDGPADSQTVTMSADDGNGGTAETSFELTVHNAAPLAGVVAAPAAPVLVGTEIVAGVTFADPGALDTHVAVLDWGDGQTSQGMVNETGGSGTASGSHVYDEAGVYTVCVTVTDNDGGVGDSHYEYVVVFDPSAGFVTGGGWIESPAGAHKADPGLSGRANFGFVSRYKKGATVPDGATEFNFKAGNLDFHSDTQQWLIVNQGGANAQFKGTGTVNGEYAPGGEPFHFMIWAGDATGVGGTDTFRIKIWYEDENEVVVYDNGVKQPIGGGSIVLHAK